MGVNIIRLHAADAPVGEEPGKLEQLQGGAAFWTTLRRIQQEIQPRRTGPVRLFRGETEREGHLPPHRPDCGPGVSAGATVWTIPAARRPASSVIAMYNERLIQLQKEYAKELLCHVNPYTGLALIDDPAVVTIQLNNEDTAIKGNMGGDAG